MNFFDLLLDDYTNDPFFSNYRLLKRRPKEECGTDDYVKYLKYLAEYRKREDEKIRKMLNTKRDGIDKKLEEIDKDIDKTEDELAEAKVVLNDLDMNLQNVIDSVRAGYEHDKVKKMAEIAGKKDLERSGDAFACANVMYICMDKYNKWEKCTKRVKELERKLSALYRDKSNLTETLTNIGFYITEEEDGSPSEV